MADITKTYPWFKVYSKGWLNGTIREQLTPAERSVWADLLALANESRIRGVICRAKNIPYKREYLASLLNIPVELLNSTIDKCSKDENADDTRTRIQLDKKGCIIITNWDKYQAIPVRIRNMKTAKEKAIEKAKREAKKQPPTMGASEELIKVSESLDKAVEYFRGSTKDKFEDRQND